MLSRLTFALTPLLALVTAAFALNYLYAATVHVRARSWPLATLYALLGIGGLALAASLWRARRQVRAARPPAGTGGTPDA
jgi:hypothetical protein